MSANHPGHGSGLRKLPRLFVRGVVALSVVYAIVLAILLSLENRLLYRPHARGGHWLPAPTELHVEEVWLQSRGGDAIHAWWCPRGCVQDAVLFCHGNSGNFSQRGGDLKKIAEVLEVSILIFDYPGYGRSSGTPSEAGCYAAADAAYEWLAERIPPQHIVILGQSLGGGVATDVAARHPHRALALIKTFTSIPDIALAKVPVLPARLLMRNQFDNLAKIERCGGPTFIAHGDCDDLIPLAQAQRLYAAASAPKEFFLMEGCGHHGGISRDFLLRLATFLREKS